MSLEELRKKIEDLKKERDRIATQISVLEEELKETLARLKSDFGVEYEDLENVIQSLKKEIEECLKKI